MTELTVVENKSKVDHKPTQKEIKHKLRRITAKGFNRHGGRFMSRYLKVMFMGKKGVISFLTGYDEGRFSMGSAGINHVGI